MTTPQPQGQSAPTPSTTSAAKTGMAWYNGCSEAERARWHAAAGSAVPADAYRAFCGQTTAQPTAGEPEQMPAEDTPKPPEVQKLHEAATQARAAWADAMARTIPTGSVVRVYIGASAHCIRITGYSTHSYAEGRAYGVNEKTGKRRAFHFTQIIGYPFSEYNEKGSIWWPRAQHIR